MLKTWQFVDLMISLIDIVATQIDVGKPYLGLPQQTAFDPQAVLKYTADRECV